MSDFADFSILSMRFENGIIQGSGEWDKGKRYRGFPSCVTYVKYIPWHKLKNATFGNEK